MEEDGCVYIIPRQLVARAEVMAGVGPAEAGILLLGAGVGFVAQWVVALLASVFPGAAVPFLIARAIVAVLPPAACRVATRPAPGGRIMDYVLAMVRYWRRGDRPYLYGRPSGWVGLPGACDDVAKEGHGMLARAAKATKANTGGAAQAWVAERVRTVDDGILWRADGVPISVVCVLPAAMALLSERARGLRVAGLHEAFAGITGSWQMISVQRAVDLDGYLAALEAVLQEAATPMQRSLARDYLGHVRSLVGGGQAREQRHYVLLGPDPTQPRTWKEADARKAGVTLVGALGEANLTARVATAAEIRDLLTTYLQPSRRADEPLTPDAGVTTWEGVAQ